MCHVTAKEGTALVFNHDTLHEGLPVRDGVKYIIRTEIMYHCVDREMIPDPMSYQSDENYLTTIALYKKSWQLEQGNEIKASKASLIPRLSSPLHVCNCRNDL